jgi:hypothetical protein
VVLRDLTTVGGGTVLDPAPPRSRDAGRLDLLARGDPASIVAAIVHEPVTAAVLARRALLAPSELEAGLSTLERAGDWYFARAWLDDVAANVRERLAERAASAPLDPGLPLAELLPAAPWSQAIVPLLGIERRGAKAYLPGTAASLGDRAAAAEKLERELEESGVMPLAVEDRELAAYLEAEGRLVRLGDGQAVSAGAYEHARATLLDECERSGRITLARFRDLLDTSRRAAQLLLERFDADGVTRRVGDERVLRRAARR